jgi:type IV secretory pathway VirB6-like protein
VRFRSQFAVRTVLCGFVTRVTDASNNPPYVLQPANEGQVMTTDVAGYLASALVLLTFMTKDMRLLRIVAILSNIAFIAYGVLGSLAPIFVLHLLLLPLNIVRLKELRRTR